MKTTYESKLNAHITRDDEGKVRHIRHNQELWESGEDIPRVSAETYLNEWADVLGIPKEQFQNLSKNVTFYEPRKQGVEYNRHEEKQMFDSTTVGFYQTYLNTPVWRKGISVKVKQGPDRVVGCTNNTEYELKGSLPGKDAIEEYVKAFQQIAVNKTAAKVGMSGSAAPDDAGKIIRKALKLKGPAKAGDGSATGGVETLSGKFYVYKYDPKTRYGGKPAPPDKISADEVPAETQEFSLLDLPPVADKIKAGRAYLVAEMIFKYAPPGFPDLVWLVLIEVETRSVLYIECMTQGVNGFVFRRDPQVKTGDLTITSDDNNAALNPQRDDVVLTDLNAPVNNVQSLKGTYVTISEVENPAVAAPTMPAGTDFDFDVRTNNFGAVNAYFHQTELIKTIESLGFPRAVYFDGTTFPYPVDHRGMGASAGNTINAHWSPNGSGGTGHLCFALCDTTNTGNPVCRAVDPWVHWHEMGGHGVLGDHVNSGLLGFAHSMGDGLAAVQMDPDSALRNMPERFRYAPFRPIPVVNGFAVERRFDRDVATWAWGSAVVLGPSGPNTKPLVSGDDGAYGSEQILATCHFRVYRSIGGDAAQLGRRQFASRVMSYLILRTVGQLTPGTNPNTPESWCEEMRSADLENWTTEGLSGGAYNKVIRWSFERQGAFQPVGAPTPVTTPGAPPDIDVYIDDGRHGEYQFQAVHWNNQSVWNRQKNDGLPGHQNAKDNKKNFLFGKIKNRGTKKATKVNVRAFHTLPGAGLTWPTDFVEMQPIGGILVPGVDANNAQEVQVGPFTWEPNINAFGHDCVLMIASVKGDPSNIDNFTGAETIQEWRLVPNDNNIGQRNITVLPGAGGAEALVASLRGVFFIGGNNLSRLATMTLKVDMPRILRAKNWKLGFEGITGKFRMKAGEKRKIELKLEKGEEFTREEIRGSVDPPMITVSLFADDILVGGMSYFIDAGLKAPSGGSQE